MLRQKQIFLPLVLLCSILTESFLHAQSSPDFSFKLAFLKHDKSVYTSQDINRPVKMQNGNKFKLFIESEKEASIYIINENPDGRVSVILRSTLLPKCSLFIPSKDKSFSIKPPEGIDKIFIIASAFPQKNLEKLLDELKNKKGELNRESQAVCDEIRRIKQEISGMGNDPVKPAPIGGTERGTSCTDMENLTVNQYYGRNIYVKTIRISH